MDQGVEVTQDHFSNWLYARWALEGCILFSVFETTFLFWQQAVLYMVTCLILGAVLESRWPELEEPDGVWPQSIGTTLGTVGILRLIAGTVGI